jgi:xyloglucan-specific exo-beta-1,4-glucanase
VLGADHHSGLTGTCHIKYADNQWPGGLTANITINNIGASRIDGWTLTFT